MIAMGASPLIEDTDGQNVGSYAVELDELEREEFVTLYIQAKL